MTCQAGDFGQSHMIIEQERPQGGNENIRENLLEKQRSLLWMSLLGGRSAEWGLARTSPLKIARPGPQAPQVEAAEQGC